MISVKGKAYNRHDILSFSLNQCVGRHDKTFMTSVSNKAYSSLDFHDFREKAKHNAETTFLASVSNNGYRIHDKSYMNSV